MDSSPSTRERIVVAALDGFVAGGLTPPSVRLLARAAGVSTGSVQHFFPTQDQLRDAVDAHVAGLVVASFEETTTGAAAVEVGHELGQRLTEFTRDHPAASRYLAHRLVERDPTAQRLLDAIVELAVAQWAQLDLDGHVAPDVDRLWAALHVVVVTVGTVLLGDALDRHLPASRTSPAGFDRWRHAQTALFNGLLQIPPEETT